MLRIGLVGAGFIAAEHARSYSRIEGAEIAGIASRNGGAAELADEYAPDAPTFDDAEGLLEGVDPDVVDVCTPTYTHRRFVELAAGRGHDVLCEKPIARTLSDANAIADAVGEAGVTFMVGHTVRFSPAYAEAKRLVDAGEVGTPGVIRTSRVGPFPDWGTGNWFADVEKSGGVLLDLAVHDFDYLRWTFGEVDRVFARAARWERDSKLMEHVVTTLRFADGAVAHVTGSWAQPEAREFTYSLEVAGDDGLIEFDGDRTMPFRAFTEEGVTTAVPTGKPAMQREIEHFLDCVEGGADPRVTAEDAIEAARIALAALESADRGEPVAVEEVAR